MDPNDWTITGNAGTKPDKNFLGTTDGQPLIINPPPSGGHVGIGTTNLYNQHSNLHVASTGGHVNLTLEDPGHMTAAVAAGESGVYLGAQGPGAAQGPGNIYLTYNNTYDGDFAGGGTTALFVSGSDGSVGIGTTTPKAKLVVDPQGAGGVVIGNSNTEAGGFTSLTLDISAASGGHARLQAIKSSGAEWGDLALNSEGGNVGIGTVSPQAKLDVSGDIRVAGDMILSGADCAEEFDIAEAAEVEPGMVVVFDQDGTLHPCEQAYDKRVAGVISGAGDYRPGLILDRQQAQENRMPVALVGKTYCKVDAQYTPINVGDLLTTSPTPGHAMKAGDPLRAFGAVLGKALHPLQAGQGMIPILIALH